jgi:hypothetical protein
MACALAITARACRWEENVSTASNNLTLRHPTREGRSPTSTRLLAHGGAARKTTDERTPIPQSRAPDPGRIEREAAYRRRRSSGLRGLASIGSASDASAPSPLPYLGPRLMKFHSLNRKVHYWASIIVALPVVVVVTSGILLQLKKELPWVQPPEQRGSGRQPTVSMHQVLEACRSVPGIEVRDWEDINRIDIRPSRGILKVQVKNSWEIQIDSGTGEVLQVAYRRSDIIESIHDGSWFHEAAKYAVFLPAAVILLLMWCTGVYLFVLPYLVRSRRRRSPDLQPHVQRPQYTRRR